VVNFTIQLNQAIFRSSSTLLPAFLPILLQITDRAEETVTMCNTRVITTIILEARTEMVEIFVDVLWQARF
jgi:hypothetical protein